MWMILLDSSRLFLECVCRKRGSCHFATVLTLAEQGHACALRHLVSDFLAEATAFYDIFGRHYLVKKVG